MEALTMIARALPLSKAGNARARQVSLPLPLLLFIEGSFRSCARCDGIDYRGREYQKADWKRHRRAAARFGQRRKKKKKKNRVLFLFDCKLISGLPI
jgi:hypothetical protein